MKKVEYRHYFLKITSTEFPFKGTQPAGVQLAALVETCLRDWGINAEVTVLYGSPRPLGEIDVL